MFRRRDLDDDPELLALGLESDPELRDEPDPDPLVEAATERLREPLSALSAVDAWGRPVAWRHVARIVLGAAAAEPPQPTEAPAENAEWRTFFRAVDKADRLLTIVPAARESAEPTSIDVSWSVA
jgi:hypothetical protein